MQALLPVAVVLLGMARIAVLILPFRTYAWVLGKSDSDSRRLALTDREAERALTIGRTVRTAAVLTPWRSVCLPQALVAAGLMRAWNLPYVVHLGVARAKGGSRAMEAHAWVRAGNVMLTGGGAIARYTVVASYRHGKAPGAD